MRSLSVIAREIRADWQKPYFGAVPYLAAMSTLNSVNDNYGWDSDRSIVNYFLANASTWRGDVAEIQQVADYFKQQLLDVVEFDSDSVTVTDGEREYIFKWWTDRLQYLCENETFTD